MPVFIQKQIIIKNYNICFRPDNSKMSNEESVMSS